MIASDLLPIYQYEIFQIVQEEFGCQKSVQTQSWATPKNVGECLFDTNFHREPYFF